ncbi:MAG: hypothetical protein K2M44_01740 [Clostridia bacterium]|nr:hypothetical protein [Clostridia bacterium]
MNTHTVKQQRLPIAVAVCMVMLIAFGCCVASLSAHNSIYAFTDGGASAIKIEELLLDAYDTSKADGDVFSGKQFGKLVDALRSDAEAEIDISNVSAKNAEDIRTINGGQDVVVSIGNMLWTVTDMRKADNGHMIATMWLVQSDDVSSWSKWSADTPTSAYPSNMYSTSYIRAQALNSGGCGYVATSGATTLTTVAQSESHQYAKFTMNEVNVEEAGKTRNLSLTKFIVQPRNVAYQKTECVNTYLTGWYTQPNDAWGTPSQEKYYSSNMNYSKKAHYSDWADDYLWLPSIPEVGVSNVSIWKTSAAQRSNSTYTWVRSGFYNLATEGCRLNASGGNGNQTTVTTCAVRPAFHFDLTLASEFTDAIPVPTVAAADIGKEYNGDVQTIALSDFDSKKMSATITGVDPLGNEIAEADIVFDDTKGEVSAKNAGKYTVELELSDSESDVWHDAKGGSDKRTLTFTITPKQLTIELTIDTPSSAWLWTVGGDYTATLTASGIIAGDTVSMTAAYASDQVGGASKSIAAVQSGEQTVVTMPFSELPIGSYRLTAELDKSADGNDNINYSIEKGASNVGLPKSFTVQAKKIDTSKIAWEYTAVGPSGNPIPSGSNLAITEGKQIVYALFGTLDSYGAVTNKLEIKRSTLPKDDKGNILVEIDNTASSFNGTTYTDGYYNQSASKVNHYTTKVLLKIVNDDYLFDNNKKQIELTINWEIVKAKFNISGVKWKYKYTTDTGNVSGIYDAETTKLEYNDGKIIRVEIDSTTLPLGLVAAGGIFDYQGASGIEVKKYIAKVGGDTLEYDDTSFEQPADIVLNWEIFGKGIAVKWKAVPSGTYYLKELNCDPKYTSGEDRIVHYKYYAPDGSLLGIDEEGKKALADKVEAEGIGVENPQTFKIVAYLDGNNSGNYRLLTDPAETTVSIGSDPFTPVQAQLPDKADYDGNAHFTQDEIKFIGASIGAKDYTVTYYLGDNVTDLSKNTKLDGAPSDAGKYVIEIEMTDDSYLLSHSVFAVEILPKQVAAPTVKEVSFNGSQFDLLDLLTGYDAQIMSLDGDISVINAGSYRITVTLKSANYAWATLEDTSVRELVISYGVSPAEIVEYWSNASGTPTFVIQSKWAEFVSATYEYVDMDGNIVAKSDLVVGTQYKLVAKLSGPYADNFVITDADGNVLESPTQSVSQPFTYGYDPSNPNNPSNNGGGSADDDWYKKIMLLHLIVDGVMAVIVLGIIILVAAILKRMGDKSKSSAHTDSTRDNKAGGNTR